MMLLGATLSFAQEQRSGGKGHPPAEAISACQDKTVGSECSMSTPKGDILKGTCKNTPDNKYFICMPSNMGSHNGPPPQN